MSKKILNNSYQFLTDLLNEIGLRINDKNYLRLAMAALDCPTWVRGTTPWINSLNLEQRLNWELNDMELENESC